MKLSKRILIFIVSYHLISLPCHAQTDKFFDFSANGKSLGAEYVSGDSPGTVLMKVNLWGAVNRPGIHHVPVKTDLMSLMSYAGGPLSSAELDEVTIKREIGNKRKLITVNVQELISGVSHHQIQLSPNDIVVIPKDDPLVDRDTLVMASFFSLVISSILAVTIINRNTD